MFSIWSSVLKWYVIESHASIFNLVYSIFQNIKTNWLSWSDIIMLDNLCNLKTFLMKISTTILTLKNLRAMRYCNFMSLLTIIIMLIYLLLFNKSTMKLIEILCHYCIKISIDCNIFYFCLWKIFSCIQVWHSCMYCCTKLCISNQ